MQPTRTCAVMIGAIALLAGCGGDDDSDASDAGSDAPSAAATAAPTAPAAEAQPPATLAADSTVAPEPDASDASDAAGGSGGTVTAEQVCSAIDPADVEAAVGPVKEIQQIDETYCNVILDLDGLGNMLSVSIQPPVMPGQEPGALFDATVEGRRMIAGEGTEVTPIDGLGDRAAAVHAPSGDVMVVLVGDTVVNFDPHLSEGALTADQWTTVLAPALAGLA